MPHITIESPSVLTKQVNWREFFQKVHIRLSSAGYGRLDDFKSRVINLDYWQVADKNEDVLFLFATLETMNPRTPEMIRAMGSVITEELEIIAKKIANDRWLQVCVRVSGTPVEDYFKVHINAPDLKSGNCKVGETTQ
jgi:5-carboxymethyl-2-hydroxymuconate isomerase